MILSPPMSTPREQMILELFARFDETVVSYEVYLSTRMFKVFTLVMTKSWPEERMVLAMRTNHSIRELVFLSKRRVLLKQSVAYAERSHTSWGPGMEEYSKKIVSSLVTLSKKRNPICLDWRSGGRARNAASTSLLCDVILKASLELQRVTAQRHSVITVDKLILAEPNCPRENTTGVHLFNVLCNSTGIRDFHLIGITPKDLMEREAEQLLKNLGLQTLRVEASLSLPDVHELRSALEELDHLELNNLSNSSGILCTLLSDFESNALQVLRVHGDHVPIRTMALDGYYDFMQQVQCVNLRVLDLSDNSLGISFAEACRDGLQHMPALEEINLSDNLLDDKAVVALGAGLQHTQKLQVLDLSSNRVAQGATLTKLLCTLQRMQHMKLLRLEEWNYDVLCCANNRVACGPGAHFVVRPRYVAVPAGAAVHGFKLADVLPDPVQTPDYDEGSPEGVRVYLDTFVGAPPPGMSFTEVVWAPTPIAGAEPAQTVLTQVLSCSSEVTPCASSLPSGSSASDSDASDSDASNSDW